MTVFGQMLGVIQEKVVDHELRIEIYNEIIQIIEVEKLMPSTCFLLGLDPAFDEAHKKLESEKKNGQCLEIR